MTKRRLTLAELERAHGHLEAMLHILEPLGAAGDLTTEGGLQVDEFNESTEYVARWIANEKLAARVRELMRRGGGA